MVPPAPLLVIHIGMRASESPGGVSHDAEAGVGIGQGVQCRVKYYQMWDTVIMLSFRHEHNEDKGGIEPIGLERFQAKIPASFVAQRGRHFRQKLSR